MPKVSQQNRIRKYMEEHGSITQMEATHELSCTKLSTRISEMRANGENIIGTMETSTNKFGEPCRYMRYRMGDANAG